MKPPTDKSRVLLLHTGLSEQTALEYEKNLILFYGRKDLGTGLLRNMTDGGEGVSGWTPDEGWRKKKSESMRGASNPFYGKTHTPDQIQKLKKNRKGKGSGERNFFHGVRLSGELNPMYGKERPDLAERNRQNCPSRGTKWFNNGEVEKRFLPGSEPEGFVLGRIFKRKEKDQGLPGM